MNVIGYFAYISRPGHEGFDFRSTAVSEDELLEQIMDNFPDDVVIELAMPVVDAVLITA